MLEVEELALFRMRGAIHELPARVHRAVEEVVERPTPDLQGVAIVSVDRVGEGRARRLPAARDQIAKAQMPAVNTGAVEMTIRQVRTLE